MNISRTLALVFLRHSDSIRRCGLGWYQPPSMWLSFVYQRVQRILTSIEYCPCLTSRIWTANATTARTITNPVFPRYHFSWLLISSFVRSDKVLSIWLALCVVRKNFGGCAKLSHCSCQLAALWHTLFVLHHAASPDTKYRDQPDKYLWQSCYAVCVIIVVHVIYLQVS